MTTSNLNRFLHTHIPLSAHMGMKVLALEAGRVQIHLPRARNLNPHGTVFGGALTALGLVSGWSLVYSAFERAGVPTKLVGQRSECEFLAPATGDCSSETCCDEKELQALIKRFRDGGKARIELATSIRVGNIEVARHQGVYAALPE
tara:strand:+ start:1364 stop:1804 length:441 start_codon:yes stop_codon:yes gene_type:complete